jgi:hypothetical protein
MIKALDLLDLTAVQRTVEYNHNEEDFEVGVYCERQTNEDAKKKPQLMSLPLE